MFFAVQGVLTFESVDEILLNVTNQANATILLTGDAVYFLLFKAVLSFESVDEILKCHYSNECLAVILLITVYCTTSRRVPGLVREFNCLVPHFGIIGF